LLKVKTNKRYAGSSKWTVKVSYNMPLELIMVIDEDYAAIILLIEGLIPICFI
jgi:hypothetical protein